MEMNAKPQEQHQWLHKLLGEWDTEAEADCGPGQPVHKTQGRESVRSVGGLWVQCEGAGEMPGGGNATMLMTLGFDPKRQVFVGTWIGSMMTHLWVYEGRLDAAQKVLTLEAEGPSFTEEGKTAKYRDVIEIVSPDHRMLTSHLLNPDGSWTQFMTAHYRRRR